MARSRIEKCKHEIIFLCNSKTKQRKQFVRIISNEVIRALSDVIATLLYGNLGNKLSEKERKNLRKHKKALIKLADGKTTIKNKRKIIQRGGGLLTSIGGFLERLFGL